MSNFGSNCSGSTDKKVVYLLGKEITDQEASCVDKNREDETVMQVEPVAAFTAPEKARKYHRFKMASDRLQRSSPLIWKVELDPVAEETHYIQAGLVYISQTGYMPRQPRKVELLEEELGKFAYGFMTYSIPYDTFGIYDPRNLNEFQGHGYSLESGNLVTYRMLQVTVPGSSFLSLRYQAMVLCRRLDLAYAWDNDERTADVINQTRKNSSLWKARR